MGIFLINLMVFLFPECFFYFPSEEFSRILFVYLSDMVFFPDFVLMIDRLVFCFCVAAIRALSLNAFLSSWIWLINWLYTWFTRHSRMKIWTICSFFYYMSDSIHLRKKCTLGVVYGGLGIRKLKILLKKIEIHFPAINFCLILGYKTWIWIRNPEPRVGSEIRIRK